MTNEELRSAVLGAIGRVAPEADLERLAPEADIREALDIDSMDFLSYAAALHESLGVDVPERDYGKISSLAGALSYLAARAGGVS